MKTDIYIEMLHRRALKEYQKHVTIRRLIWLVLIMVATLGLVVVLTGCADTAQRHVVNTNEGHALFVAMRCEAKEGSQDWLRERLGRIAEQYDAKTITREQYSEEVEKALKTYFMRADNREELSDDEAKWLMGMVVEATSIPGTWGLIGNFAEQTMRGVKRLGAKVSEKEKGDGKKECSQGE